MLIYYKLFGIIKIDFFSILAFLIGIFFGFVLFLLIYLVLVLMTLSNKKYQTKIEGEGLTEEKAKEMILVSKKSFKDKKLRGDLSLTVHFRNLSMDLISGIASSFYPNSKYPYFELTVDESLELLTYVKERGQEILNRRIFKLFKRFSISTIVNISLTSKKITESEAYKRAKDTTGKLGKIKNALSIINPLNFLKNITMGKAVNIALTKLYLVLLSIIGEEAFKIYSKKALNKEVTIDSGIEDEINEGELELLELEKEINNKKDNKELVNNNINKANLKFMSKSYKNDININYESIFNSNQRMKENRNV